MSAASLARGVLGLLHTAVDFFDRLHDLRAPAFVGGGGELAIELGARQPQRLQRVLFLRVANDFAAVLACPLALQLFHALLNSRFRIDKAFARITHESPSPRRTASHYKMTR